MKTTLSLIVLLMASPLSAVLRGQITIVNGSAANSSEIKSSGTYTQDFDSLASLGSSYHLESNVTLNGWYVDGFTGFLTTTRKAYDSLSLKNYGDTLNGIITSPYRALGMIGATYFGLRFANATDLTITGLDVTFDGEQWERSQNNPQRSDTLHFQYQIFDANEGQLFGTGWTTVEELNFTSVNAIDTTYVYLDGNAEANRIADINHFISGLTIESGQEIWLRWMGIDNPGNNHGLGIDNLRVSFATIPEPSVMAALMGTLTLAFATARRRRQY